MKKFNMSRYITSRMEKIRGNTQPSLLMDEETENYTSKRIRELRGEKVVWETPDTQIDRYCSLRIQELKKEQKTRDSKLFLDNRKLGCYTVDRMGDTDADH